MAGRIQAAETIIDGRRRGGNRTQPTVSLAQLVRNGGERPLAINDRSRQQMRRSRIHRCRVTIHGVANTRTDIRIWCRGARGCYIGIVFMYRQVVDD
ncbi:MAG TPA: hypothetical protein VGJ48_06010 [Pyrinomonadaceae bacterium]